MRNTFLSLLWIAAAILVASSPATVADAAVITQHVGQDDPLTEGFEYYLTPTGTAGPANDGEDYWGITSGAGQRLMYQNPTVPAFGDPSGWTASIRVRGIEGTMPTYAQCGFEITTGTKDIWIGLNDGTGTLSRGIYLRDSVNAYIHQGDIDPTVYHTYQLVYDPTDSTNISLYVDGSLFVKHELSWFADLVYDPGAFWGDGHGKTSVAADHHWALVRVETGVHLYSDYPPFLNFPGDADRNGTVDEADAAILAEHWLVGNASWGMGDFNGDDVVDDKDATIMAANWGNTASAQRSTAVPEPSVFVTLISVGLAAWLTLCRRGM